MSLPADDPWGRLRQFTAARIGLTRTGSSVGTAAQLAFLLAHAQARDAVHAPFDAQAIIEGLNARGLAAVHLASQAPDRSRYLTAPDLGRRLDNDSVERLSPGTRPCGLALVIADGLSALAVHRHALAMIDTLDLKGLTLGPVAVVERGRVAIGDEIGALSKADMVAVLIGERPGLSSPDSLGLYLTWNPRVGCKDADRNCISNIRPEGLGYVEAAAKFAYLAGEARRRKLTGVMLKDETGTALLNQ